MGKSIVVFIHGHMGCAKQFSAIVSGMKDVDCTCVTLPGHEADIKSFLKTNRKDWQRCVAALLEQLRQEYDDIILVGHSMGGLLSINAAISCPDHIKAIVAIALPLRIKITYRGLKIRSRMVSKPNANEGKDVSAARAHNGVSGITMRNAILLLPNLNELLILMRHTRRSIPALTVPLVVINSRNDEIVSARSIDAVKKSLPSARVIALERSSHFWISDEDTACIVDTINELLHMPSVIMQM